jgi:hypothetical protein
MPQRRPANRLPPCETCKKIPPGAKPHWSNAVIPTAQSRRALAHYRECRAVNWNVADANDPLVREHAALFRGIQDAADEAKDMARLGMMMARAKDRG